MATEAPSENPSPQLFVEVRGFLELVKAVDDKGNPTDQQPLLLKLINAPPPMTPAEAEEIRDEARKAQLEKSEAEEAQKRAEEERAEALKDVQERLNALEEDRKKLDEVSSEQKKAHEEAMAKVEEEKKATLKAQQDAEASIKKVEKDNAAIIEKLKTDLEHLKSRSAKDLKSAVSKAKEELKLEKVAAEELLSQTRDKISALTKEIEELKEKSSPVESKPTPLESVAPPLLEPLGTPPTSSVDGSAVNNEIDNLVAEHLNWKNEFEDNSLNPQNSATPGMPDVAERGSFVVEQVIALPGNEIFPPKSYFVKTTQDEVLYKAAMRTRDTDYRDRILRQLAEKRNRLSHSARHEINHHRREQQQPGVLGPVDPRYSGAFIPEAHYNPPALSTSQYQRPPPPRAMTPQPNQRMRNVAPPRNGWFCCTSNRGCPDGTCCPDDCQSPPSNYYRR